MKKNNFLAIVAMLAAVPVWGQYKMTISQDCTKNGHENSSTKHWDIVYVDLDLPSGTKWATTNIGATTASQWGTGFMWGEIKKDGGSLIDTKDYPSVLPAEMDAARANWGGQWRMPTIAEVQELYTECTTQSGSGVVRFTSKKDPNKYIEAPTSGSNFYWTSSMDAGKNNIYAPQNLQNTRTVSKTNYTNKYYIRPVWGGNAQ